MSMHDEVLDLYGGDGTVEDIERSKDFANVRNRQTRPEEFDAEALYIRKLRLELEKLLREQRPLTQVKLCLELLYRAKKQDREAYYRLIKGAYYKYWSDTQKKYFDDAYTVIAGNTYYFLSFTHHNPTNGAINIINREHQGFIEFTLGKELEGIGDFVRKNMLAEAINYYLCNAYLDGFYYPLHNGDNAVVKEKLTKACNLALTFIQIIHAAIFFKADDVNFCWFEYDKVRQSGVCKKMFFVLAEQRDDVKNLRLRNTDFGSWLASAVDEQDALELIPTPGRNFDDAAIRENRKNVKQRIVNAISNIRKLMFEDIPP